ncbi:hypothetical protein Dda_0182 [Drechslerella dactyloides]|uniref:Uncharacterized protein n=1 Tax=Drechslerella dactyloides TaxID=74499 RepID=A0AAD6J7L9_DREDA|nr:hypothetical protein Dda_0182 [Drechslerella dactyloides]
MLYRNDPESSPPSCTVNRLSMLHDIDGRPSAYPSKLDSAGMSRWHGTQGARIAPPAVDVPSAMPYSRLSYSERFDIEGLEQANSIATDTVNV